MEKLLTIATSDCSGGAGVQADLKTFAANGTYGMSVFAALTSQNTMGVSKVYNLPVDFIKSQLDDIFQDIYPDGIKIGMVPEGDMIIAIKEKLVEYNAKNIVLDPVMVATSGSKLMDQEGTKAMVEELFSIADIITPNMDEASALSGIEVNNKEDMVEAAKLINKFTSNYILIKGGHLKDSSDDLLYKNGDMIWIEGERIDNSNTHGTGCTLSSAIAVNLAKGKSMEEAVREAKKYLTGAIKDGMNIGKGHGPLNHIYNLKNIEE